jgi:histidine triad (HIT) family protein
MENCTFCKIVVKELPSEIVHEDADTLVILDINPVNPGHLLVLPKVHYEDFLATPDELAMKLMKVAKKLAGPLMEATGATAFNVGINNGHDAGQAVGHLHIHVMPRHHNDGHVHWQGKPYGQGEMAAMRLGIQERMTLDDSAATV